MRHFSNFFERYGMRMNTKKTEYVEHGVQEQGTISVGGADLPKSEEFRYLGSLVTTDGNSASATTARVSAGWLKWRATTGVLCDKRIPERLKGKAYRTIIRPALLYGSETLAQSAKADRILNAAEMKMLRWPLGLTRLDKVRNEDVRKRMGVATIMEKAQEKRLRWYGHLRRMEPDGVARRAMDMEVKGKRPKGRPKLRWMDAINKDLTARGLQPKDASDRLRWRKMTRHADPVTKRE